MQALSATIKWSPRGNTFSSCQEDRCKAIWKRGFKLSWREAGLPNHANDKVDSDQQVGNEDRSLFSSSLG